MVQNMKICSYFLHFTLVRQFCLTVLLSAMGQRIGSICHNYKYRHFWEFTQYFIFLLDFKDYYAST